MHHHAHKFTTDPYLKIILYTKHICPLCFLLIDILMNRIQINRDSLHFNNLFNAFYVIFNITVALYHKPIYPMLTFTDIKSFIFLTLFLAVNHIGW